MQTPLGAETNPAFGDMTMRVSSSDAAPSPTAGFALGDSVQNVFSTFASTGLSPGQRYLEQVGMIGAASATATLQPGESRVLSIVFSWYFAHRDHMGFDVGNYYATQFADSSEVAQKYASDAALTNTVDTLTRFHSVFAGPTSSLPIFMQDAAVNEFSHFRGMIFTLDGRMREFEANDCPDVDSIHNDYQRHLPYIWTMKEFEISKLEKWGASIYPDDHIPEYLGAFSLSPLDQPGGRTMADTTTLFIAEMYELYSHTGDFDFLQTWYPTIKRALNWLTTNAKAYGLPDHLVCTYDIINFGQYNTTTFNALLYLTALRAGREIATVVNDPAVVQQCDTAFSVGQAAMQTLLWNSTYQYYRAYTGGEAVQGDSLYGQMVSSYLGFGPLVDVAQLVSHIAAEEKYNGNPFGYTVVTGRNTQPPLTSETLFSSPAFRRLPGYVREKAVKDSAYAEYLVSAHGPLRIDTVDDVVWEGAGPTNSFLNVALDQVQFPDLSLSLDGVRRSTDNFRLRLKDIWNLVGITTSNDWAPPSNSTDTFINGMPYVTSHYGFLLPNYYIILALSGQQTNIPNGTLSFNPRIPAPLSLPFVMANTLGTFSVDATGTNHTLTLSFGSLYLPANGLSISGSNYPNPVSLSEGQSISW
jgi:non-lysosomal glucosylceramidase